MAVEKTRRIDVSIFGEGTEVIADILRKNVPGIKITSSASADDEQYEEIKDSDWYKRIKKLTKPGDVLSIRRENANMTQAQLSEKSGVAIPNISLMEAGKRPIGPRVAKKLAGALGIDYKDLL